MEPRQGGRFHIWHMLTREMPFCNLCASKDGTFERENCAPKRPARFQGPRSRVRDIFGAGNHYSAVLNGSAIVYTCGAWLITHRTVLQTKTPVAKGWGY